MHLLETVGERFLIDVDLLQLREFVLQAFFEGDLSQIIILWFGLPREGILSQSGLHISNSGHADLISTFLWDNASLVLDQVHMFLRSPVGIGLWVTLTNQDRVRLLALGLSLARLELLFSWAVT